ncbi:hypothetical protein HAL_38780 [Haladaptatus sp. T7]|nr:hypothetical protein HAL_38780 [Haladaptatus sp. T7]
MCFSWVGTPSGFCRPTVQWSRGAVIRSAASIRSGEYRAVQFASFGRECAYRKRTITETKLTPRWILYHSHVPKLVDLDVIEFDGDTETITPGPHAVQVLTALEGAGGSLDNRQETHARSEFDREDTQ